MNKKLPSSACLLISTAPSTSTSMIGILPLALILSSSLYAVPYLAPAFLAYYSMNSFPAAIFWNSSSEMKWKFDSAFSRVASLFSLVVYDFFLSKRSPYWLRMESIRVFLPTPDGPTRMSGLYLRGVLLNGWKYSLA